MQQEPLIISASRRTDIPAHYSQWLWHRLDAGFCTVVNPFSPRQVSVVSLVPSDVTAFVFWTRNPAPMLDHEELFRKLEMHYAFYFLFTLNGYPAVFEPVLHKRREEAIDTFCRLSRRVGNRRVIWRYDPVIISTVTDYEFHRANFSSLAARLSGRTDRVIISIVDDYRTVRKRFALLEKQHGVRVRGKEELASDMDFFRLMTFLRETAEDVGMTMQSCCESIELESSGIRAGACIDLQRVNEARRALRAMPGEHLLWDRGGELAKYRKDTGQRERCLCTRSRDIGAPLSCTHRCVYCYASPGDYDFGKTSTRCRTQQNGNLSNHGGECHDPRSPSLIGWHEPDGWTAGLMT